MRPLKMLCLALAMPTWTFVVVTLALHITKVFINLFYTFEQHHSYITNSYNNYARYAKKNYSII